jgi:hypothetical protein
MRKFFMIAMCLTLSGCIEFEAKLEERELNKETSCTDTRDGEVFFFNTSNIKNGRYDLKDICFDVIDNSGKQRHLCKSHEVFLKCSKVRK